ncbi:MAG TPA: hypothetical protein VIH86_07310, partial [Puia sp.]
ADQQYFCHVIFKNIFPGCCWSATNNGSLISNPQIKKIAESLICTALYRMTITYAERCDVESRVFRSRCWSLTNNIYFM